eukprot:TRINITY_DN7487_c0_g1_i1.p1 TRINITY_DN7487_c0_g1~~TRINITY_DN7487_c0_g1_i1.p1  ORF type:complete len:312 (-),score=40.61 TRINITY_DN7487_c0_g1_i1:62-997(-)
MEDFTSTSAVNLLVTKIKAPNVKSKFDALFLLLHAFMESAGFRVVGIGEAPDNLIQDKQLPTDWNASLEAWAFRYRHFRSAMTFLLKGLRLGHTLLVHALALEQNEILTLELAVSDYVKDNCALEALSAECFERVDELCAAFKSKVILKLVPGVADLQPPAQPARPTQPPSGATPAPDGQPGRAGPAPSPYDPLRIGPVHRPPPRYPFSSGGDDLLPGPGGGFGYLPGGGPLAPYPFDPFSGGGGSLVGPHHPGFGLRDPRMPPFPNRGGPTPFPPPPGARFDPFGPPGVRPNPDHDHLPPPGHYDDDMFI